LHNSCDSSFSGLDASAQISFKTLTAAVHQAKPLKLLLIQLPVENHISQCWF